MASAFRDRAPLAGTVLIGEVGLSGEVRRVSRVAARLVEARSLGFTRAVVPKSNLADVESDGVQVEGVATIREALAKIALSD
jgi:DNA repair protein RadA/Sms